MATVYPSSDGYFQQNNAPCHKAQIISNWILEPDNESPDLNPLEQLWDVVDRKLRGLDVHPTNLHQLQDAILSISILNSLSYSRNQFEMIQAL